MQEDEEGGPLARMRRGKERMLAALWPTSTIPLHLEFPGLRVTPGTALATLHLLHPAQQAHLVLGFLPQLQHVPQFHILSSGVVKGSSETLTCPMQTTQAVE